MASDPTALLQSLLGTVGQGYNGMRQVQGDQQALQVGQQQIALGQAKLNALQQAQQQAQQYQTDVQDYFKDPSPQRLAQLAVKYPDQAQALQQSYKIMGEAQKQSVIGQFGGIYNAARNGRADLTSRLVGDIITAEKAKGLDTSEAEDLKARLDTGDKDALKYAQAFAQMHLAAADPEFAKAAGIGGDRFSNTPQGDIYSKETGEVTHEGQPKPIVKLVRNGDGSTSVVQFGIDGQTTAPATGEHIEQAALDAVPGMTVTSRARTPEHNAAVGGVPNSYHLTDQARDFVPPAGTSMTEAAAKLKAALPGMKVLNEGDHIHVQPMARNTAAGPKVLYTSGAKPAAPEDASANLDDSTMQTMAEQYLAGDKTVFQNLGRGKQGSANIVRLRQKVAQLAKAQGLSGKDIAAQMADFTATTAASRAVGARIAAVDLAATEAEKLAPIAMRLSDQFQRSGLLTVAKFGQSYANQTNDPKYRQFVAANNALVNAYSRAIAPSGAPTVSDKEHARDLLNTAYDNGSYRATVQQMLREISAAKEAPRQVRSDIRQNVVNGGGQQPTRTATNPKTGQRIGLINGQWVPLS